MISVKLIPKSCFMKLNVAGRIHGQSHFSSRLIQPKLFLIFYDKTIRRVAVKKDDCFIYSSESSRRVTLRGIQLQTRKVLNENRTPDQSHSPRGTLIKRSCLLHFLERKPMG